MNIIRIGWVTGLMVAFGVITNELTHGGVFLAVTDWMKIFGG